LKKGEPESKSPFSRGI